MSRSNLVNPQQVVANLPQGLKPWVMKIEPFNAALEALLHPKSEFSAAESYPQALKRG